MPGTIDPDVALASGIAHRLALGFAVLVTDQLLVSESDVPYSPFVAAFPADRGISATALRDELGFDPERQVVLRPGTAFFDAVVTAAVEAGDTRGEQAYLVLQRVMARSLGTLHQAFVRGQGVVEVPFLLFGRLAGGPLVGLRSTAIET